MITLAELKAFLGIAEGDTSQDVTLTLLVDTAIGIVEAETGYKYTAPEGEDPVIETFTEEIISEGGDYMVLSKTNLAGLTEISVKATPDETYEALEVEDYFVAKAGFLHAKSAFLKGYYYRVQYTYGDGLVPADLKYACLVIAKSLKNDATSVKSERIGDYSVTYDVASVQNTIDSLANVFLRYKDIDLC